MKRIRPQWEDYMPVVDEDMDDQSIYIVDTESRIDYIMDLEQYIDYLEQTLERYEEQLSSMP